MKVALPLELEGTINVFISAYIQGSQMITQTNAPVQKVLVQWKGKTIEIHMERFIYYEKSIY